MPVNKNSKQMSDKPKKDKKNNDVYQINETDHFNKWMKKLKNFEVRKHLQALIARLRERGIGNTKSVGDRVSELRGQRYGYRIYFTVRKKIVAYTACWRSQGFVAKGY